VDNAGRWWRGGWMGGELLYITMPQFRGCRNRNPTLGEAVILILMNFLRLVIVSGWCFVFGIVMFNEVLSVRGIVGRF
jgi:hypothetical protein